jgi:hypothetical protein
VPIERPNQKRRRRWLWPALALAALAGVGWYLAGGAAPAPTRAAAAPAGGGQPFFGPVAGQAGLPLPDERARQRELLLQNYQLADHTLCSYRETTRYPTGSRPMAQNPDQVYPNQPVSEMKPMRLQDGGNDPAVQVQTAQSRVYMAAGDAVAFSLRAVDAQGRVLPLVVTRATAQGIVYRNGRPTPQVALAFADDGNGADPVAGDGAFAAVLAPGQTGLASFYGTIRTEVRYSVEGKSGLAIYDVIYSPELPATWAGPVRDLAENGSLAFVLRLDVRMPGRYVITGRVDDARGQPFALLTFNDLLGPGPNEVRLTVFGKLLRDQQPALPLTLRDVDGYLLKENADPDRALLPRREGVLHVSKAWPLKGFSDAEWQGEERIRYLNEFGKDLAAARAALADFDPTLPPPPSACASPPQR